MLKEHLLEWVIEFAIENEIEDVNFDDKNGVAEASKVFLLIYFDLEVNQLAILLIYYGRDAVKRKEFENAHGLRNEI